MDVRPILKLKVWTLSTPPFGGAGGLPGQMPGNLGGSVRTNSAGTSRQAIPQRYRYTGTKTTRRIVPEGATPATNRRRLQRLNTARLPISQNIEIDTHHAFRATASGLGKHALAAFEGSRQPRPAQGVGGERGLHGGRGVISAKV